jgi:hypothetical protein
MARHKYKGSKQHRQYTGINCFSFHKRYFNI